MSKGRWKSKLNREELESMVETQKKFRKNYLKKYMREYLKKFRATDYGKECGKRSSLKRKYGLTLEQVDEMLIAQNHKCAICRKELKEGKRHIDHNHVTGKVRGILCPRCNLGLGFIEDIPYRQSAEKYLKKMGW